MAVFYLRKVLRPPGLRPELKDTKKDIGLIMSEVPAVCAAVYTTNQFQAAPLKVHRKVFRRKAVFKLSS